jgi:hypothetical protein
MSCQVLAAPQPAAACSAAPRKPLGLNGPGRCRRAYPLRAAPRPPQGGRPHRARPGGHPDGTAYITGWMLIMPPAPAHVVARAAGLRARQQIAISLLVQRPQNNHSTQYSSAQALCSVMQHVARGATRRDVDQCGAGQVQAVKLHGPGPAYSAAMCCLAAAWPCGCSCAPAPKLQAPTASLLQAPPAQPGWAAQPRPCRLPVRQERPAAGQQQRLRVARALSSTVGPDACDAAADLVYLPTYYVHTTKCYMQPRVSKGHGHTAPAQNTHAHTPLLSPSPPPTMDTPHARPSSGGPASGHGRLRQQPRQRPG